MDPVALRQANYAEVDAHSKLPFTGKHLDACYSQGAERFGWSKRNPEPGSMREERSGLRIGWGMATETCPANSGPASALVRMQPDGRVLVPAGSMTTAVQSNARFHGHNASAGEIIEATAAIEPDESLKRKASAHSFGAVFAEVTVDPELGMVKVRRIVAVFDVGGVLNEQTARSQFIGGIVCGISLALLENTLVDARTGRFANGNLSEYHVPVNADIGEIDVSALNIPDTTFNSIGVRDIGEIGITGTAAAISNAVFHATGIRVRDLPITLDKLQAHPGSNN